MNVNIYQNLRICQGFSLICLLAYIHIYRIDIAIKHIPISPVGVIKITIRGLGI